MTENIFNRPAYFGRVVTAMITPFDEDGGVDYQQAGQLAIHLVEQGSDGIVVSGTTGESATLNVDEKIRLFTAVKAAVGNRASVLAGTGSYSTADTIVLTHAAQGAGVDGVLVVTPYYNKPSQRGLYEHFKSVANASSLPVVLYNVPGRTGVNLEAGTCLALAAVDNIVAVKEASKDLQQIGEIAAGSPPDFQIYSGDDAVTLPILSLGGVGVISVISHLISAELQEMHQAFFRGDLAEAQAIHLKTLALTRAMFAVPSPVPTKTALAMIGIIDSDSVRLPLVDATEIERSGILEAIQRYGLIG